MREENKSKRKDNFNRPVGTTTENTEQKENKQLEEIIKLLKKIIELLPKKPISSEDL